MPASIRFIFFLFLFESEMFCAQGSLALGDCGSRQRERLLVVRFYLACGISLFFPRVYCCSNLHRYRGVDVDGNVYFLSLAVHTTALGVYGMACVVVRACVCVCVPTRVRARVTPQHQARLTSSPPAALRLPTCQTFTPASRACHPLKCRHQTSTELLFCVKDANGSPCRGAPTRTL